jgi:Ion channel
VSKRSIDDSETRFENFTTLTTVGYGDLTARTGLGHTLSVSEGLLGQIYLVTVVSLIVTNLGRRRPAVQ